MSILRLRDEVLEDVVGGKKYTLYDIPSLPPFTAGGDAPPILSGATFLGWVQQSKLPKSERSGDLGVASYNGKNYVPVFLVGGRKPESPDAIVVNDLFFRITLGKHKTI